MNHSFYVAVFDQLFKDFIHAAGCSFEITEKLNPEKVCMEKININA